MIVDRSKALTAEHAGRPHYFCSDHCLHQFETDPDRYTGAAGAPAADHDHEPVPTGSHH
jgi:Cu+-exporting ATPase